MGGVNLFLTLVGFARGDPPSLPPTGSLRTIVPAFQAVYGGYVLPVGAEFFQEDLVPDPDVFAAKIAVQYIFGAQLGWFSLGGRDNQVPPMGIYDLLMSPSVDTEIAYLRTLSRAKQLAADWFNFGRAMRPVPLSVNQTGSISRRPLHPRSSRDLEHVGVAFGAVMSSTWLAADSQSLLVTITTVKRATPASVHASIDVREYGFPTVSPNDRFDVFGMDVGDRSAGPWRKLGTFSAATVTIRSTLGVRAVVLLKIAMAV